MPSTLLIFSDDKLCRQAYSLLKQSKVDMDRIDLARDSVSNDPWRVLRLIRKRVLPLAVVVRMAWAEMCRPGYDKIPFRTSIDSNSKLEGLLREGGYDKVFLFRAGLIIGRKVLDMPVDILNIHGATIPEYGGLGAVSKALAKGELQQYACLHRVTTIIDDPSGLVDREPYLLDPALGYRANEDIANGACARLLARTLKAEGLFV